MSEKPRLLDVIVGEEVTFREHDYTVTELDDSKQWITLKPLEAGAGFETLTLSYEDFDEEGT